MSQVRANSITNAAGSGAPDFPNGLTAATLPAANLTGSLPAINGSALTNLPAPTSAQVGTATAGLSVGAVGSYAFLWRDNTNTPLGGAVSGSLLYYTVMNDSSSTAGAPATYLAAGRVYSASQPSGTWIAMGSAGAYTDGVQGEATVYLRIS